MRKHFILWQLCFFSLLLLAGCDKGNTTSISINVTTSLEVSTSALNDVSVALVEGITRETVSNIQHDFIQDGKQVGGIVIVDISNEMLDAPYENLLRISDMLSQQLMPNVDSEKTMFMGAGGNEYAYMEVYTGDDQIRYFHYLFRGEAHNYDVWFACDLIDADAIAKIIASISADDITEELNNSIM